MALKRLAVLLVTVAVLAPYVRGQDREYNQGHVPDRVTELSDPEFFDSLTGPYVQMARYTYPDAEKRYLAGLPPGWDFQVVTRVYDTAKYAFEQIFVKVFEISGERIRGLVNSEVGRVPGYALGDSIEVLVDSVYDWCIRTPEGKEEGNYVGKFGDVYLDGRVALILELRAGGDGKVKSATFLSANSLFGQDVTFCIPDSAKRLAEMQCRNLKYDDVDTTKAFYTYVVYLYHEGKIEGAGEL